MVEPNPPRFIREGDTLEFTVKVSNTTSEIDVAVRTTMSVGALLTPDQAAQADKAQADAA